MKSINLNWVTISNDRFTKKEEKVGRSTSYLFNIHFAFNSIVLVSS